MDPVWPEAALARAQPLWGSRACRCWRPARPGPVGAGSWGGAARGPCKGAGRPRAAACPASRRLAGASRHLAGAGRRLAGLQGRGAPQARNTAPRPRPQRTGSAAVRCARGVAKHAAAAAGAHVSQRHQPGGPGRVAIGQPRNSTAQLRRHQAPWSVMPDAARSSLPCHRCPLERSRRAAHQAG